MESRRTPLHAEHEALGAMFTDFAGWRMPLRYDSELAEHHAVRTSAGLFDLTHMGEIVLTGPEAGAALDHALVGHASAIGVGRARYTMICEADGGVIDDLIVYRTGDEEYLVVANASNVDVVLAELRERCAGSDVEVRDESAATALVAVQVRAPGQRVQRQFRPVRQPLLQPLLQDQPLPPNLHRGDRPVLGDR